MNALSLLFVLSSSLHLIAQIHFPAEKHLKNVRQLTFDGYNIRARFSQNGRYIVYVAFGDVYESDCFQVYRIDLCKPHEPPFRLSMGFGEFSTASFFPDNERVLLTTNFHSHLPLGNKSVSEICELKSMEHIFKTFCEGEVCEYDLFEFNKYGNIRRRLTAKNRYVEAAISSDGQWVAYSRRKNRTVDDLYLMKYDGSEMWKLSNTNSRKGDVTFSPDNSKVIFEDCTSNVFTNQTREPLAHPCEIFKIDLRNKQPKQITHLGGWNVSPVYHPNNRQIFFSSCFNKECTFKYDIYTIDENGDKLEKITFNDEGADLFPAFNSDGSKMLWSSTRNTSNNLNLFIADYIEKVDEVPRNTLRCPLEETDLPNSSRHQLKRLKKLAQTHFEKEKHLLNVKQLTFGGQNAEGYFSLDRKQIVLQAAGVQRYGTECDQIYSLKIDKSVDDKTALRRLSTGLGACTCAYWFPDGETSIHASTFASVTQKQLVNSCPTKKCQSPESKTDPLLKKLCNTSYTWDLFPEYDIYKVNQYGNIIKRLTNTYGYDAEGAISPDGTKIVFTSMRTGDPELWLMDSNGNNLRQLTNETGYDGGPFFSWDGKKISFRASRPRQGDELTKYKQLLSYNLVEPLKMELYSINVDGSEMAQITHLGGSNWAPFFLNDNKRIVFSTNFNSTEHFGAFDLYLINQNGSGIERVTYNEGGFDAFPMMSSDGKKFIWGSSRNGKTQMDLNLFLADWIN